MNIMAMQPTTGEEVSGVGIMYTAFFTSHEPLFVLLRILLIILLTAMVIRITLAATRKKSKQRLHYLIVRKLVVAAIFVVGLVFALGQLPEFDNIVATILAGSGIAALGISLAAQQSLGNLISGMVISASKPFEVGDRVRLINGNITGNVEDITLRHTVIRTFMNSRIIIPNSVINSDMIENSHFVEVRASNFLDATITYDSDMEKAMQIMAQVIGDHPNFVDTREPEQMDDPKVPIFIRGLSIYGVELRASVWTKSISNNFVTCSELRRQLKLAFDDAGIKFAASMMAAPPPPEG